MFTRGGAPAPEADYTGYVDVKIGTGGHGHVFVGANVPFEFGAARPHQHPREWDWVSGYHDSDSTVIGFSHTHFSGTGIGDLFDVSVMPVVGSDLTYARGKEDDPQSGLWSYADRSREVARPGYYSVPLTRYGITAELTATNRVGFHRYTFPASDSAAIVIDLQNGGCWDRTTAASMKELNDSTVVGYRFSRGGLPIRRYILPPAPPSLSARSSSRGRMICMGASTSPPPPASRSCSRWPLACVGRGRAGQSRCRAARMELRGHRGRCKGRMELRARTGEDRDPRQCGAHQVLHRSLPHHDRPLDLSGCRRHLLWSRRKDPSGDGHTNYTTYSLWDTYRAAMPLMSIINPDRNADMINTMLNICDQQGRLPGVAFLGQ